MVFLGGNQAEKLDIFLPCMYIFRKVVFYCINKGDHYGKDCFGDRFQPGDRCGNR